jgi:hypothetical protein
VTNTGNATLTFTSVAVTGDFSQTNNCGTQLAAGAMCTASITFKPSGVGQRTGTVTATDNATGSPHSAILTGTGTDFGLSVPSPNATVTAGQSATYNVVVIPLSGYNQAVSLTCAGAPSTASCTVNPASMTLDGATPVTVKVTVTTTTRSAASPTGLRWILAMLVLGMIAIAIRRRYFVRLIWLAPALILLVLFWSSCGVGSNKVTGTLPGTYALTVTAAGGALTHQASLALNVN